MFRPFRTDTTGGFLIKTPAFISYLLNYILARIPGSNTALTPVCLCRGSGGGGTYNAIVMSDALEVYYYYHSPNTSYSIFLSRSIPF